MYKCDKLDTLIQKKLVLHVRFFLMHIKMYNNSSAKYYQNLLVEEKEKKH